MSMKPMRSFASLAVATAATAAICCAAPTAASAQAPPAQPPSTSVFDDVAKTLKLEATPRDPADFVRASRKPGELDYVPVGGARPEPAQPLMTPDQIRAREAELESLRARQDALARRKPAARTRSAAPGSVKTAKAAQRHCLITCRVDSSVVTTVNSGIAPSRQQ